MSKRWWLKYRSGRPKMFTPLDAKGVVVPGTGRYPRRKHRGPWTGEENDAEGARSRRENEARDYERWADDGGHHS